MTEILLSAIDAMGGRRVCQLADAMLLLECVSCIKALMNSKVGLEYMIQHKESIGKLVNGEYVCGKYISNNSKRYLFTINLIHYTIYLPIKRRE